MIGRIRCVAASSIALAAAAPPHAQVSDHKPCFGVSKWSCTLQQELITQFAIDSATSAAHLIVQSTQPTQPQDKDARHNRDDPDLARCVARALAALLPDLRQGRWRHVLRLLRAVPRRRVLSCLSKCWNHQIINARPSPSWRSSQLAKQGDQELNLFKWPRHRSDEQLIKRRRTPWTTASASPVH